MEDGKAKGKEKKRTSQGGVGGERGGGQAPRGSRETETSVGGKERKKSEISIQVPKHTLVIPHCK